jgi:undecaprenyl-phosphate 4-deoxy-4-formamido-L-arabinose transferase
LRYSTGDYAVIIDDDFQNPPEAVRNLVKTAVGGEYDVVYSNYPKKKHGFFRNLGSRFNNLIAGILLDVPRNLYLSSFKCLSRFAVNEIVKYTGPFPYIDGLLLRATRRIGKIEVEHHKRQEGKSGYTFRKLVHLWLNMFVNFSIMPLRISSILGLIFSGFGLVLSAIVVIEKLNNPSLPIGWPSLIIAFLVFAGVQLFILGLLGEYLGRLYLSSNQTPQYVVREMYKGSDD